MHSKIVPKYLLIYLAIGPVQTKSPTHHLCDMHLNTSAIVVICLAVSSSRDNCISECISAADNWVYSFSFYSLLFHFSLFSLLLFLFVCKLQFLSPRHFNCILFPVCRNIHEIHCITAKLAFNMKSLSFFLSFFLFASVLLKWIRGLHFSRSAYVCLNTVLQWTLTFRSSSMQGRAPCGIRKGSKSIQLVESHAFFHKKLQKQG